MQTLEVLETHDTGKKNEHKNTQNNVFEGETIRCMNVDTYQQYQETVELDANIIFQLKNRDD